MKELTKQELEKLYYENTNDEVCRILGITKVTLVKYVKQAGIEPKGKGGGMCSPKLQIVSEKG
ncbi:MAG: hypothetical protein PQJ59_16770 [Spirochaetales bacterium]|nr:hypothetical protein [Spirochaetales bacterium]